MKTIYTIDHGPLALKPERKEIARQHGVVVLLFGEQMPEGGILLADTRPRAFKGPRTTEDPAATAIYDGGTYTGKKPRHFENFDRALKAAIRMARGN